MSKYLWNALKLVGVVLVTLGLTTGSVAAEKDFYLPADPLQGAGLFTGKGCDKCHAIEGQGGSYGPDLARVPLDGSLLDIVALMWNHQPQMNMIMGDLQLGRPKFTGSELARLVAYIYYIAYFDKPGDIARGREVFSAKGCRNCHRVGGLGRAVGPDLGPLKKYVSPIFLAQKMWNHGPQILARMNELGIEWPEFNGREISDLAAFLRDASPVTDPERVFMRPGDPQKGEKLFAKKRCLTCHHVLGRGTAIGPDLTRSTFHKSVTAIASVMWNHGPAIWGKMAELGQQAPTLADNEMADLIAFLYFLRFFEQTPDVARGEMLFGQKGCRRCHHFGEAIVTGSVNLSSTTADQSVFDIVAEMLNDADLMSEMMTRRKLEWPRCAPGEMNDIIAYILNHRQPAATDAEPESGGEGGGK